MMPRRTRFDYGAETFTTSLPVRAWQPADRTIGGSKTAAAGLPASYVIRRDQLLEITLRITEAEWATWVNLIAFGQSSQSLLWYPDANDDAIAIEVYLEAPLAGERWTPTRDANYPRVFETTITLRGVGTAVPWRPYFEEL